ncbi:MAG: hypothetical protein QM541_04180 [Flavobacterium sp.]|nr:hypothetical protein [Flavobacterium sp.]
MKKIGLVALIAFAACNSTPKVAPAKEIPLEEQLSHIDDSVRDIATKIFTDSTVLKDSVFKKQFEALGIRREALKKQIEAQEYDSLLKK